MNEAKEAYRCIDILACQIPCKEQKEESRIGIFSVSI